MTCFDMHLVLLLSSMAPEIVFGKFWVMYSLGSITSEQIRCAFGVVDKDFGVPLGTSVLFLQSTSKPKCAKKSAPRMGCVTSAIVKFHTNA
jgi:hypothetical protein